MQKDQENLPQDLASSVEQASTYASLAREEEKWYDKGFRHFGKGLDNLTQWLRPQAPSETPVPSSIAAYLTDRVPFHDLLSYRSFDEERKLTYLTSADSFRAGFILGFSPLIAAGTDIESQLEAVLTNCPAYSVVQFGVLSSGQTQHILNSWLTSRLSDNPHSMLQEMALRRAEFFKQSSDHGGTLTYGGSVFQPRNYFYYISVSLAYPGDPADSDELNLFLNNLIDVRVTIEGALKGAMIPSAALDKQSTEFLINELVNPQFTPEERRSRLGSNSPWPQALVDRQNRVTVQPNGYIRFHGVPASEEDEADTKPVQDIVASVLTMDAPPMMGYLPFTAALMGDPASRDDRISCAFWLHTTIYIPHPDKTKDRLVMKVGSLNKQVMSDSPWYRSMMGHLYTQKDEIDELISSTRQGHAPMRLWMGIVLYNTPDRAKRETEFVANLWRKAGYRCSPERYISLPVFLAGLPMMYDPLIDPVGKGLQRANTVNSFNAASMLHVQGDWQGTAATRGGPLLVSRRGQLACVDLFDTSSNYNFVVVAQSGSGKSFFSNELAVDFLSRNGVARIFDVGRSYKRFASVMGGAILEFSPDNPVSLNPFSDIETEDQLYELMPMLKSLVRQMAFPLSDDESMGTKFNWEYQAIEQAITQAWKLNKEDCALSHVYAWMNDQDDMRYRDLAFQLHSFAVGRYSVWFNGPRQVHLNNDLIIVELEDLEVDPDLQAVVLTLMIHQITKDMYLSDPERKRPKLLLVDEAWRLLGSKQSGGFIAKAFRTVRKYRGSAGVITQSFSDFAASASARAALENSSWQFVLKQKPESIDFAVEQKWISDDAHLVGMLKSINSDSAAGFSEIFIRGETGQGAFRFITDRHSYWLYTTNPIDLAKLATVQRDRELNLLDAVDYLARLDYETKKHPFTPEQGSLLEKLATKQKKHLEKN